MILGLLTPVYSKPMAERPVDVIRRNFHELMERFTPGSDNREAVVEPLRQLRAAQREVLPPVQRIQVGLHLWVAFGVMPLFALANAGVSFAGANLGDAMSQHVFAGVMIALVLGKPLGVLLVSLLLVKLNICRLPEGVTWGGVGLVGLLAGIGFTMSIFIAALAFTDPTLLASAKLSVLAASTVAAMLGLVWGKLVFGKGRVG